MHTSQSTDATVPQTADAKTLQASDPPTTDFATGLIVIMSLALLGSFFLPWINFLGVDLSGFNLQKLSDANRIFWAIPFLAFCTIVLALGGRGDNFTRYLASLSPFVILAIIVSQHGPEFIQHLEFGAWLALISGGILVLIPSPTRPQKEA